MLECIDDKYIPERMLASLDGSQLIDNMNRLMRTYDPVLLASIKQKSDTGEIAPLHIPKNLPDDFWLLEDDIEPPSLWGIGGGDLLAEEDQARRKDAEKVAQQYYIIYMYVFLLSPCLDPPQMFCAMSAETVCPHRRAVPSRIMTRRVECACIVDPSTYGILTILSAR